MHWWVPFGGLRATYDDHLSLIGKRVVDFILVLMELCSLGVTAYRRYIHERISVENRRFRSKAGWPKIWGRRVREVEGVAHTNHSSSQKTRLNDLSYGIKIWTDLSSVLSQSTRLIDRQTDGQTAFSWLDRPAFNAADKNGNDVPVRSRLTRTPVMGCESYRVRWNNANYTAITPLKVIPHRRFWHQSKARMRLPPNLPPVLHRFQVMADYWSNFRYRYWSAPTPYRPR